MNENGDFFVQVCEKYVNNLSVLPLVFDGYFLYNEAVRKFGGLKFFVPHTRKKGWFPL